MKRQQTYEEIQTDIGSVKASPTFFKTFGFMQKDNTNLPPIVKLRAHI